MSSENPDLLIPFSQPGSLLANRNVTAEHLMMRVKPVHPETKNSDILALFRSNHHFSSIPVVQDSKPVGLVNRYYFIDRMARPLQRELLGNRPCSHVMHNEPMLIDKDTTIHELSYLLAEGESRNFVDGFIVTEAGYYLGIVTGQDLLRAINQMQIEDFRISATAFESREGMLITDVNGIIIRVNRAFTDITGYAPEEIVGKKPSMLSSGRHDADFYRTMWASINETGSWEGEIWNKRKNAEVYPEHLIITAVKDPDGRVTNYVACLSDITSNKAAEIEIRNLAFYDPLTNLPNRRLLLDRLNQASASSARSGKEGALLFIDLDNFKTLNDSLGHDMGDLLLKQVAQRVSSCVRESDTVARFGGDEFVVLLEDLSEVASEAASDAKMVGEKILSTVTAPYQLLEHKYHCTSSIGVALFSDHKLMIEEILKHADIAMYHAKKEGRNTLRFFDPEMQQAVNAKAALESELHRALEDEQFRLFYQVQVAESGKPVGAEVLIRWIHPEQGLISPAKFLPMLEETELIHSVGLWVIEAACEQLKKWENDETTRHLVLAVNLSAKQFRQVDFVDNVEAIVKRHAIDPRLLKLELTESLLLKNVEETITTMNALRGIGVRFSLDDFGTGYSSLQYLKRLPLDQLKIDQSFVRDIVVDNNDRTIVRTIIAMAQNLNLDVIAEGVEVPEQQAFLQESGCMHFQGFLFGKPMPIDQFEVMLGG